MQADKVQTRYLADAALMRRSAFDVENRQVDPGKSRLVAGAPDDIPYFERTPILQQWFPVLHARDSPDSFDARIDQVFRLDADQRRRAVQQLRAPLSSHRSVQSQNMVPEEANNSKRNFAGKRGIDIPRDVSRFLARNPRLVAARHVDRNICA